MTSEEDGIVGINPEAGTICEADCKEYRYTGSNVKNYVMLKNKQTSDGDEVEELWRIIGVFTDEDTDEKYMRIVRNEVLPGTMLPFYYKANGTTYQVKISSTGVLWNKGDKNNNDWSTAGLQYYLNGEEDESGNKGYMSYLSEETKAMLEERTHYIGNSIYFENTAVSGYQHERDVKSCVGGKGATSSSSDFPVSGCNVWDGNAATWKGSVYLMYPSDYGFSADKQYWTGTALKNYSGDAKDTSWMYETMKEAKSEYSWMISPAYDSTDVIFWDTIGYVFIEQASFGSGYGYAVRVVLNLKSQVRIVSGDGTEEKPYQLEA